MDIIKKLFNFEYEDNCAIGLCKFNEESFKTTDGREEMKKRLKKEKNLTQILKRNS